MSPTPVATAPSSPPRQTLSQALTQKIRELLKARRWSQREFARQLGVTQGAVSYLLDGKRRAADLDYYERLAEVFQLPLSVLIHDLEAQVASPSPTLSPAAERPTASVYFDRTATLVESTLVRAFVEALRTHLPDALLDAQAAPRRARPRLDAAPKPPRRSRPPQRPTSRDAEAG